MAKTVSSPIADDERDRVAAVRAFNRFYTAHTGLLSDGLLETPYSLTEARILFELAQGQASELGELRAALRLDAGYLSRVVSRLEAAGLLTRSRSTADRRRQLIRLTTEGRAAFRTLDRRSAGQVAALLAELSAERQRRLLEAMGAIQDLLGDGSETQRPLVVLRQAEAGELGWIVHRHGALYAQEYGWDRSFEALVARIVADYMDRAGTEGERAWIAERGGRPVGSVLCTRKSKTVAQLRLLLVEPEARGIGIGGRLVEEVIAFARRSGYRRLTLWTNDVLTDAGRIYERAGFALKEEEPHHSFGVDLVGQTWERSL